MPNSPVTEPVVADEAPLAIAARGVSKSFGTHRVLDDVDLAVAPGDTVALLGPSGCGKTTLLRTIAGLEHPDAGSITIDGQLVVGGRHRMPPERRRIGMVFQDWALFPHMTVGANVGYGLDRDARRRGRVEESLELVGLGGLGDRMPSTLSGGQQQRVALARALAPRPKAILLDEPFSNLDTALRVQIRSEVHALLADLGITTIFVTHDQEEAFVLGDQVAVMSGGRIVQQASPAELYDTPTSPWVATFVGDANLLAAEADGDVATTEIGVVPLRSPAHGRVQVLLRPEQVVVAPAETAAHRDPGGVPAVVELVEFYGHDCVTIVRCEDGTELRTRQAGAPRVRRGDAVRVAAGPGPTVAFAQRTTDSPTSGTSVSAASAV